MTISTEHTPLSYNGDDSTTAFAITWKYFAKSDVVATLRSSTGAETVWVLTANYTLTAAGSTGTLTAVVAPATGETLVITLKPPNLQTKSIPDGGAFPSQKVEDGLDIASQRDAAIEDLFDRTLRVPKTDKQTGSSLALDIDSDRANKFLSFDANGKPIMAAGTSANLGPVSAFIDTFLDDADAETARATLGAAIAYDIVICVLSHSYPGLPAWVSRWPDVLETMLRQGGVYARVINCSIDSNTYKKANEDAIFDTKTAVGYLTDQDPDVALVGLAVNDLLNQQIASIPVRTLADIEADADTLFTAIAAGIPSASKIIYFGTRIYDSTNYTLAGSGATTINNEGVMPYWQGFADATAHPGEANARTTESLLLSAPNVADPPVAPLKDQHVKFRERLTDWGLLDTYVKANSDVDGDFEMDAFACGRLGMTFGDGVHPQGIMSYFLAGYAYKYFRTNAAIQTAFPVLKKLVNYGIGNWQDPDTLFLAAMLDSGTAWVPNYADAGWPEWRWFANQHGFPYGIHEKNWFRDYLLEVTIPKVSVSITAGIDHYTWIIEHAEPETIVNVKIWLQSAAETTASFSSTGVTTTKSGFAFANEHGDKLGLVAGTYWVKYQVGNDSSDAIQVILTA